MDPNFDIQNIKLIVGLGNTGKDYEKTRHNAGFLFVDQLLTRFDGAPWKESTHLRHSRIHLDGQKLLLAKPTTLMNNSGRAVVQLKSYYQLKPSEILVAHDDLDIELGKFKLHKVREPKDHRGLISVNTHLNTKEYWRLRIGIESRSDHDIPGIDFVLGRFTAEQLVMLEACFDEISEKVLQLQGHQRKVNI